MSLGRHTLFNIGGAAFPILIGLITVPLYLGYIGVERYGVLAVIWALLGYFGFFDAGFGRAVTQRMARLSDATESQRSRLLWTALISTFFLGLFASAVLWGFSDYILLNKIEMSAQTRAEVSGAILWMLLALPVLLPTTVLQGALQARLRFLEVNAIQLLGTVISQLLPLTMAACGYVELTVLVPAALASRILVVILLSQQSRRYVPLTGPAVIDGTHLRALVSYGGWISVMTFLAPLLVTIDRIIIAAISGAKAVAFYTVPYDLASRTTIISGGLSTALFPRLASASPDQAVMLAERATKVLISVMTPVVLTATFAVSPFLNLWVGPEFARSSAGVAELILLGVWINALVIPHGARMLATGNPRTVVLIYLVEIPIYLAMLWVGIKYYGVAGAALAWSLRILIDTCALLYVNGALSRTWGTAYPSALLVVCGTIGVVFLEAHPFARLSIGIFLIFLAFYRSRADLLYVINALRQRAEVMT